MAQPEALRLLRELQNRPENKVMPRVGQRGTLIVAQGSAAARRTVLRALWRLRSRGDGITLILVRESAGLRGLRPEEPAVGERELRHLHVPRVQR